MRYTLRLLLVGLATFLIAFNLCAQAPVWTYHNDNARTGANTNETILTTTNVNTNFFGKLFTYTTDGYIFAQPLYMPNVAIPGKGTHNVVYVATEGDTVYAFDADSNSGSNSTPLWSTNLLQAGENTVTTNDVGTMDISPQIGITGTPVIDTNAGTLFVVAKSKHVSGGTTNYYQRLHALNIADGTERPNSPVVLQGSVAGTGQETSGGKVPFDTFRENQRSGLLLLSNVVYIPFASHGDNSPWHGWIMGYNKTNLTQVSIYNTTPNSFYGGVWQGGNGPAADTNGNFFLMTGNGGYDGPTNNDYGDSFLKLTVTNASTNLFLADFFTPYNQYQLGGTTSADSDIGAGGPIVLPDAVGSATHKHLLVGAGKGNNSYGGVTLYLIDRDNMGHYNAGGSSDSQIVQEITGAMNVPNLSTGTYFNYRIYYLSYIDRIKAYSISNAVLSTTPVDQSSTVISTYFGPTMAISANGTNNGILWAINNDKGKGAIATVYAFNATNLTSTLWSSTQAGTRDIGPTAVKFTVPTVANGRVYVGGQGALVVYGLGLPTILGEPASQTVNAGTNTLLTVIGQGTNFNTQWYFDGTPIAGATSTNYSISSTQLTNAGYYYAVLSNAYGVTPSSFANLSVVAPLTNAPGAVLAPQGLVNWWPGNGNAQDIVGTNNGTPVNGLTYTNGKTGQAFQFDGLSSYVNVGGPNLAPPWTLSVWAYRESSMSNGSIIMGNTSVYFKLEQYTNANGGSNSYQVGVTQLGYVDSQFPYTTPSNTWVHLAFVGSTTNVTLYANGVLAGTITTNNCPCPRTYIGTGYVTPPGKFINILHGALDDIQVYNQMLTQPQINSIYSAGSASLICAPQVTGFSGTNGQVKIGMNGLTGKSFTIYTATNIMGPWTSVTTLSGSVGTNQFTATITTNKGPKFYRVGQP